MRVQIHQLDAAVATKAQRLDQVDALVRRQEPADLILLPELWPTGFFRFDGYAADAEPIDGQVVTRMAALARSRQAHLFMGSFVERDGEELFNTSVLLGPDGRVLGAYRKIHLFGYQSRERQLLSAGREPVVVDTALGRVGLSTCYDLRFPELYRHMMERGATVFLVASAWPAARCAAWRLFNQARAHENLAWLIACNVAGESDRTPMAGHSMAVSPMGDIVCEADDQPVCMTFDCDPAAVSEARRSFPALDDRVPGRSWEQGARS